MSRNKILIIFVSLIAVLAIGYFGYNFFMKNKSENVTGTATKNENIDNKNTCEQLEDIIVTPKEVTAKTGEEVEFEIKGKFVDISTGHQCEKNLLEGKEHLEKLNIVTLNAESADVFLREDKDAAPVSDSSKKDTNGIVIPLDFGKTSKAFVKIAESPSSDTATISVDYDGKFKKEISVKIEGLAKFDPFEFVNNYEALLEKLGEIGNKNNFNYQIRELTNSEIALVKENVLSFTTEAFFENKIKPVLSMIYSGTDSVGLPHNLFPQVRINMIEQKSTETVFEILMFGNEFSTNGGVIRFKSVLEDGVWKVDDYSERESNINLTNKEIEKLYPNQKFTILEERKEPWGDQMMDVVVYSIIKDNATQYYFIYRHNGLIIETSKSVSQPEPTQSSMSGLFNGAWSHMGM